MPVFDTTVFLDLLGRGGKDAARRAAQVVSRLTPTDPAMTTRFNVAELLVGVELAIDPVAQRLRVDEILDGMGVLEFDEFSTLNFGKVFAHARRKGRPMEHMDALIAAVTLTSGLSLVTRNPRHFANVPGLVVLGY